MINTVLLATFINNRRNVSSVLKLISDNFEVNNDKVFLLKNSDDEDQYVLTYNIIRKDVKFSDIVRNTISLHRKKDTNTLYTLNALNEVVLLQNNGQLDESFSVDWNEYKNCILLTKYMEDDISDTESETFELRRINTELVKVFTLR